MAFDITGKCLSDSVSSSDEFDPNEELIDTDDILVRNAVPDSEGNFIYFLGRNASNQDGVFSVGLDRVVCTLFTADNLGSVIAISSDNKQLIINGFDPGSSSNQLWRLDIALSGCTTSIPQSIPWSDGYYAAWFDILPDGNGDAYYFVADPGFVGGAGFYIGAVNYSKQLNADWTTLAPARIVIGLSLKLFLTTEKQLSEINPDDESTPPLAEHLDLGETIPFEGGHMALNLAENTLYVPIDSETQHRVVRVNVANPSQTQRYVLDGGVVNKSTSLGGSLRRARKKNLFAWITSEGKLYRFEPQ